MGAISRRVSELRARKRLTAKELGDRLTGMGVPWDRFTVAALEKGKRQNVTVVELLALARALDVSPLHLLMEPKGAAAEYQVTPTETAPSDEARAWLRGMTALPETDLSLFYSEVPMQEWGCLWVLTKPKVDLDGDTPLREMSRWVRVAFAGYGYSAAIGNDDEPS